MSTTVETLLANGIEPWLADSLGRIARGSADDLAGFFVPVDTSAVANRTQTQCRVNFLRCDANGRPRVADLASKLADQVIDYCIPRSRIAEALKHLQDTGSAEHWSRLQTEARHLFTTIDKSGEGGELLLYLLLERLLRAPQVLCKMSLKTSSQMHVHGVDGVHMKALENGRVALYWCESKLYADFSSAADSCFKSIAPFLLDEGDGAASLDLLLVRDHLDTGDATLSESLRRFADRDRAESALREIRGASLIGFDHCDYPDAASDADEVRSLVTRHASAWTTKVLDRVDKCGLERFSIETFCLPLPAVDAFRRALRTRLGIDP